jgi:hypothetical protein
MEQRWNDIDRVKLKGLERNLSQGNFFPRPVDTGSFFLGAKSIADL